jgi:surface antigen
VTGPVPGPAFRRLGYNRSIGPRLSRRASRLVPVPGRPSGPRRISAWRRAAATAGILLWIGACSGPSHLGSLFAPVDSDVTGAIAKSGQPVPLTSTDLAVARAAATALLDGGGEASSSWENPLTGAHGTVTPFASVYLQGGAECRDFLASYVRDTSEAWLQGEACRDAFGRWDVRDIKPWR